MKYRLKQLLIAGVLLNCFSRLQGSLLRWRSLTKSHRSDDDG